MSNSISVTSIGSLEELETSMARFSSEVRDAIEASERQIQKKTEVLDQIVADRRRAVARWQLAYDEADYEEDDISFIQRKLEEAEENLREATRWQSRVEERCAEYNKRANQAAYLGHEHSDKARRFLRARITELCEYLAVKPSLAAGTALGSQPREPGILDAVLIATEATVGSVVSSGEAEAFAMAGLPLPKGWGKPETLEDHFERQGSKFGAGTSEEYTQHAQEFFVSAVRLKLPMKIGDVVLKITMARFSRTFSTLVAAGVDIIKAIEITSQTAGNWVVEAALIDAKQKVHEGVPISQPLVENDVFPPMVSQMIKVGEETGELDKMLGKIADFYEEEVDASIETLTSIIEPIMMIGVGLMVGVIIIAMYLPMFKMLSLVH